MSEKNAERIAQNSTIFREANEAILDRAGAYEVSGPVPFLCECAEEGCTQVIRIPLGDYERIRAEPTWFVYATGHIANAHGAATLIERLAGYDIAAKIGRAAEVARDLDPRART